MQLLPKSEVSRLKSKERQREIDEGMKIAGRVDNLRKVHADEEASLEAFRLKTVSEINQETALLTAQKDVLAKEVLDLEERREKALKPLDDEWQKIESAKLDLSLAEKELGNEQDLFLENEAKIAETLKLTKDTLARAEEEKQRADYLLSESMEANRESKQALEEARATKLSAQALKKDVLADLKERDAVLAGRERASDNRTLILDQRERALSQGEKLLKDRQALAERNIKRLKN